MTPDVLFTVTEYIDNHELRSYEVMLLMMCI